MSHRPEGIGEVNIILTDDKGQSYKANLKNVLYFPDSPVNVLSVTMLADQLNDDEGTSITTMRFKSVFLWDDEKFKKTIYHPESKLPEMYYNETFDVFESFCSFVERITSIKRNSIFTTLNTRLPDQSSAIVTDDEFSDYEFA